MSTALRFAVLGDSIAYGQGASRPADTPGERLVESLAQADIAAELRVFAVPGARSDALAGQVRSAVAWGAEIALIVIGANDLIRFVPPAVAAGQLREALTALRAADVQVVLAPAPDLSAVPWVPAQFRTLVQTGSGVLRAAQTEVALEVGALVANVHTHTAPRFGAEPRLFSADRFHPSSAGYAVIADALAPAVHAAAARAGR
ncbi:GDSL-type esterase/lipase family protein [Jatrophihabitans sp. YIM 134969]